MKDFYYILGTDTQCSLTEIQEAYKKLSERLHPDLHPNDPYFENRFREINEAYEVLSNAARRNQYDKELRKFKPYAINERHKIKRYHSGSKGVNTFFTIILIALTLILGNYVYKVMHSSKAAVTAKAPVVNEIPVVTAKHHKKMHYGKFRIANHQTGIKQHGIVKIQSIQPTTAARTALIRPTHVLPANYTKTAQPVINNNVQEHPIPAHFAPDVVNNPPADDNSVLYTTYIRANETGAVNMRKFDYFNSEIIKVIPTDARVAVLERGRMYYKIMFDNMEGYVPKWTVQTK